MEDAVSNQTRAMTEAQHMEGEVQRTTDNGEEEGQRAVQNTEEIARDPAINPIVEVHKNNDLIIEEFVQQQGGIYREGNRGTHYFLYRRTISG